MAEILTARFCATDKQTHLTTYDRTLSPAHGFKAYCGDVPGLFDSDDIAALIVNPALSTRAQGKWEPSAPGRVDCHGCRSTLLVEDIRRRVIDLRIQRDRPVGWHPWGMLIGRNAYESLSRARMVGLGPFRDKVMTMPPTAREEPERLFGVPYDSSALVGLDDWLFVDEGRDWGGQLVTPLPGQDMERLTPEEERQARGLDRPVSDYR